MHTPLMIRDRDYWIGWTEESTAFLHEGTVGVNEHTSTCRRENAGEARMQVKRSRASCLERGFQDIHEERGGHLLLTFSAKEFDRSSREQFAEIVAERFDELFGQCNFGFSDGVDYNNDHMIVRCAVRDLKTTEGLITHFINSLDALHSAKSLSFFSGCDSAFALWSQCIEIRDSRGRSYR
jgi:hypothetical protein